jgi:glycosyltransferase involved in cell wall biosynthesis
VALVKILLITSAFPGASPFAGAWIPDLIEELNKLDCYVHVLTQNCDGADTKYLRHQDGYEITRFAWRGNDMPLIDVMRRNPLLAVSFFYSTITAGYRIIKSWKPDFIFAEWMVPAGLTAFVLSKLTHVPYAVRALGSDVLIVAKKPGFRQIIKMIACKAKVLFADGFDLCEKTSCLAMGKDCFFAATGRKVGSQRSDFMPFPDHGLFKICSVGRLHPVKGQDILIQAAHILAEKGMKYRLYIVGDGDEYERLNEMIKNRQLGGQVLLTGRLEDGDVTDLLRHVDCFVIPSRSESIPLVLAEAVRANKPLIVTHVGGMASLVNQYRLGFVIPPDDPDEMAKALIKMSNPDERKKFIHDEMRREVLNILSVEGAAKTIRDKLAGESGIAG